MRFRVTFFPPCIFPTVQSFRGTWEERECRLLEAMALAVDVLADNTAEQL